jgi:hypothetical protein
MSDPEPPPPLTGRGRAAGGGRPPGSVCAVARPEAPAFEKVGSRGKDSERERERECWRGPRRDRASKRPPRLAAGEEDSDPRQHGHRRRRPEWDSDRGQRRLGVEEKERRRVGEREQRRDGLGGEAARRLRGCCCRAAAGRRGWGSGLESLDPLGAEFSSSWWDAASHQDRKQQ